MGREYRVMSALRDTPVPVPATYALEQDDSVIGSPFYVMERVGGTPYRDASDLRALGAERTRSLALRLVDTLGALHAVDPAAVGLVDFGRPTGYLPRQVARWQTQMAASKTRERPTADELHGRLAAAIPAEQPPTIVHGDYRLENVLFDADGEPAAVLDWEMATLGDPLADLGLMLMYGRLALLPPAGIVSDASRAPGYPREAEIVERYGAQTGRDVSGLGFYLALSAYKLAAILEGIHNRHTHGHTVGPGFDGLGAAIDSLLDAGLAAIQEAG
jgi:aminoglycoside phosphotransferase (APT) family kinase protein